MSKKLAVTVKEAGQILSLGRSSIYRLIGRGDLKPRKIGKRTVILVSDLEAFVSSLPEA
ncbi:MAG: helix-turn-helix domain-containing protein [Litorimonas sp.]